MRLTRSLSATVSLTQSENDVLMVFCEWCCDGVGGGVDGDRELTEGARTSKPHYFRSGTGSASASEGSLTDDCVHLFVTPNVLGLFIHL